jgi:SsrA-binding protein
LAIKIICQNKKARHDYFIDETFEAGICLEGSEVKSLRLGKATLKNSYARIMGTEVYLIGAHISPYDQVNISTQPDPTRRRKLLLHKKEIEKLIGKTKEKGYTLIALKIYFARGKAKVELGLGRGKKHYDKRETLKKRDVAREIDKAMKARNK